METPQIDHGAMAELRELIFLVETGARARAKFHQLLDQRRVLSFAEIEVEGAVSASHHVTARVELSDEFVGVLATLRAVQSDGDALIEREVKRAHGRGLL
jgi:hypothetical protein